MALLHLFSWDKDASVAGARQTVSRMTDYTIAGSTVDMNEVDGFLDDTERGLELVNSAGIQMPFTATQEVYIGFAYKRPIDLSGDRLIELRDGATFHGCLSSARNGGLTYNLSTTSLRQGAKADIPLQRWVYIELYVLIANSGGRAVVRLNGDTIIDFTGDTQNGGNATVDSVRFTDRDTLLRYEFDDMYICDASGSVNNDFLGPIKVIPISPDGDGDSSDFTPSAGANYAAVDDGDADDDTTYVESSTSTDQDLYTYENVDSGYSIVGVQIQTEVRETDGTDFTLGTVVDSGATNSVDTPQAIAGTSYEILQRMVEVDPNTSALWTATNLNAAQFGIEVG